MQSDEEEEEEEEEDEESQGLYEVSPSGDGRGAWLAVFYHQYAGSEHVSHTHQFLCTSVYQYVCVFFVFLFPLWASMNMCEHV